MQANSVTCDFLIVEGTQFQSEAEVLQSILKLCADSQSSIGGVAQPESMLLCDLRRAVINMRQIRTRGDIVNNIIALKDVDIVSGSAELVGLIGDAYYLSWADSNIYSELTEAQRLHQIAVERSDPSNAHRPELLTALANDHIAQYEQNHSGRDGDLAYSCMKQALLHISEEHEHYVYFTACMAQAVALPLSSCYNPDQTFELLEQLLSHERSSLPLRLSEALRVVNCIQRNIAPTWAPDQPLRLRLLNVYEFMISSLNLFCAVGYRGGLRLHAIAQGRDLPMEAASHALALARPDVGRAIGFIDSACTVLLTQFSQMTVDAGTEDLVPVLKTEAKSITAQFADYRHMFPAAVAKFLRPECAVDARVKRFTALLRGLAGVSRPPSDATCEALAQVASHRPIITLFAEGDALWALVAKHPAHPPTAHQLGGMTAKELHDLDSTHRLYMQNTFPIRARGMRKESLVAEDQATPLDLTLKQLWIGVIKPLIVILGLKRRSGRRRPHVLICPSGVFSSFPLHAAGIYRQDAGKECECISDYMVVSYIPALRTALNSLKKATRPLSKKSLRALLVAVPESFGMDFLPDTEEEIGIISRLMTAGTCIDIRTPIEKDEAKPIGPTADQVLAHLPEAEILHFACHGRHEELSLETGFMMSDRVLRVADMVFQHLPRARFAFLGACETARVGVSVPQSAMHLAAALLVAGFQSIIGTMWTMGDVDGPKVAQEVYGALFAGDGDHVDLSAVPYALDSAIRKLRENGVGSDRWATYIHFGI